MRDALILTRALTDPGCVAALDAASWTALLTIARAEQLLGTLAHRLAGLPVPGGVAGVLADARIWAEHERRTALWEAEMARRALAGVDVSVVLLKGTAYAAAGLAATLGCPEATDCLAAMATAAADDDAPAFWAADHALHRALLTRAGNTRAAAIVEQLRSTTALLGPRPPPPGGRCARSTPSTRRSSPRCAAATPASTRKASAYDPSTSARAAPANGATADATSAGAVSRPLSRPYERGPHRSVTAVACTSV